MKLVGMKIILFWYELHTVVFAVFLWLQISTTVHVWLKIPGHM